ncbi:MAG: AzlC family ABC transporter permease [Desulfovibrio sp.]
MTNRRADILAALQQAMPVVMGYIPVGFAYGVLARQSGVCLSSTILMSVIVFAGSGQLIAASMIGAQIAPLSIVMTTFIVNLRHLLMSASLSPHLKGYSRKELAFFTHQIVDETFAIHSLRFSEGRKSKTETFAINIIAHSAWILGGALGAFAGDLISDVRPYGLDYALPAMFIALIVSQMKDRVHLLVAIAVGALSTAMVLGGIDQWNIVIGTVFGATLGAGIEVWNRK